MEVRKSWDVQKGAEKKDPKTLQWLRQPKKRSENRHPRNR